MNNKKKKANPLAKLLATEPVPVPHGGRCPQCFEPCTAANSEEGVAPQPDDFAVCYHCGALLGYSKTLKLRPVTKEEFAQLSPSDQKYITTIQKTVLEQVARRKRIWLN